MRVKNRFEIKSIKTNNIKDLSNKSKLKLQKKSIKNIKYNNKKLKKALDKKKKNLDDYLKVKRYGELNFKNVERKKLNNTGVKKGDTSNKKLGNQNKTKSSKKIKSMKKGNKPLSKENKILAKKLSKKDRVRKKEIKNKKQNFNIDTISLKKLDEYGFPKRIKAKKINARLKKGKYNKLNSKYSKSSKEVPENLKIRDFNIKAIKRDTKKVTKIADEKKILNKHKENKLQRPTQKRKKPSAKKRDSYLNYKTKQRFRDNAVETVSQDDSFQFVEEINKNYNKIKSVRRTTNTTIKTAKGGVELVNKSYKKIKTLKKLKDKKLLNKRQISRSIAKFITEFIKKLLKKMIFIAIKIGAFIFLFVLIMSIVTTILASIIGELAYNIPMVEEDTIVEIIEIIQKLDEELIEELEEADGYFIEPSGGVIDSSDKIKYFLIVLAVEEEQKIYADKKSLKNVHENFYVFKESIAEEIVTYVYNEETEEYEEEIEFKEYLVIEIKDFYGAMDSIGFTDEEIRWATHMNQTNFDEVYVGLNLEIGGTTGILMTSEEIEQLVVELNITNEKRKRLIEIALSLVDYTYYEWGGKASGNIEYPSGLDCSGFVAWVYDRADISNILQGGGTTYQIDKSYEINKSQLKSGDLGFLRVEGGSSINNANHVGIYLGNGLWIECYSGHGVGITNGKAFNYYRKVEGVNFN